ncbi:hypothetical protein V8E36_006003 [Tilletia maclaganii]
MPSAGSKKGGKSAGESSGSRGAEASSRLQPHAQTPATPARNGSRSKKAREEDDEERALEDDGDSEESEIDLSPLPASRRASVVARLSASPEKFVDSGPSMGLDAFMPAPLAGSGPSTGSDGALDSEEARTGNGVADADEDEDDEDDDGPPVEESMTQSRSKALEAKRKAADLRKEQSLKRKRTAEAKAPADQRSNRSNRRAVLSEIESEGIEDPQGREQHHDGAGSAAEGPQETRRRPPTDLGSGAGTRTSKGAKPSPPKKGRLDPALFAEAFGQTGKATKASSSSEGSSRQTRLSAAQQQRKTRSSSNGLVRGRDGLPMKRLKDGRTIVRSLQDGSRSSGGSARAAAADEDAKAPELPDAFLSVPNAKSRSFTKKVLGLRASDIAAAAGLGSKVKKQDKEKDKKPVRTEDDPLGLEDPLFMNLGGGKKGSTKRPSTLTGRAARGGERGSAGSSGSKSSGRGEGGRRSASPSSFGSNTRGAALRFRRP